MTWGAFIIGPWTEADKDNDNPPALIDDDSTDSGGALLGVPFAAQPGCGALAAHCLLSSRLTRKDPFSRVTEGQIAEDWK